MSWRMRMWAALLWFPYWSETLVPALVSWEPSAEVGFLYLLATVATNTDVCKDKKQTDGSARSDGTTCSLPRTAPFASLLFENGMFLWYFIICMTQYRGQRSNPPTGKVSLSWWLATFPPSASLSFINSFITPTHFMYLMQILCIKWF